MGGASALHSLHCGASAARSRALAVPYGALLHVHADGESCQTAVAAAVVAAVGGSASCASCSSRLAPQQLQLRRRPHESERMLLLLLLQPAGATNGAQPGPRRRRVHAAVKASAAPASGFRGGGLGPGPG